MRDPKEVQLAWQIVELIEAVVDLIWEHYQEDFRRDIRVHEHRDKDEPWKDSPLHQPAPDIITNQKNDPRKGRPRSCLFCLFGRFTAVKNLHTLPIALSKIL